MFYSPWSLKCVWLTSHGLSSVTIITIAAICWKNRNTLSTGGSVGDLRSVSWPPLTFPLVPGQLRHSCTSGGTRSHTRTLNHTDTDVWSERSIPWTSTWQVVIYLPRKVDARIHSWVYCRLLRVPLNTQRQLQSNRKTSFIYKNSKSIRPPIHTSHHWVSPHCHWKDRLQLLDLKNKYYIQTSDTNYIIEFS